MTHGDKHTTDSNHGAANNSEQHVQMKTDKNSDNPSKVVHHGGHGENKNTNHEMDLNTYWKIENKKGKFVKLYAKNKQQEFIKTIDHAGRFSLALHTPDIIPFGGKPGPRYIEAAVRIYKNLADPPALKPHEKELKEYELVDSKYKANTLLCSYYKVHSKDATQVVEFELKENEVPACLHIIAKTHTPFIGMRFGGKLYHNVDHSADHHESTREEFTPDSDWMFKTLSVESIREELARDSEEKREAFEKGLIRPFLWLVSMHPIMRIQIGDLLGIKMIDYDGDEKWSSDPHKQAWRLINRPLKGLAYINDHSWETANPAKKQSNWWQCLYRGNRSVKVKDVDTNVDRKTKSGSLDYCCNTYDKKMSEHELDFLEACYEIHRNELKKLDKDSGILQKRIDTLLNDAKVKEYLRLVERAGIDRKEIREFLVEISVVAHFKEWQKLQYGEQSKKSKVEEWDEEDFEKYSNIIPDETYQMPPDEFLTGLNSQLLHGNYDPRGLSEAGGALAKAAAKFVAKRAFKIFVLIPFAPFLVLPWTVYGLVDKVIGSDHPTVWIVSLQILLQRLLLATHNIEIDHYYEELSREYGEKNDIKSDSKYTTHSPFSDDFAHGGSTHHDEKAAHHEAAAFHRNANEKTADTAF